jgi:hypothetical protein
MIERQPRTRMVDETRGGQAPKEQAPVTKKRYQKPVFRYERVFETLALACGKTLERTVCVHQKKVS